MSILFVAKVNRVETRKQKLKEKKIGVTLGVIKLFSERANERTNERIKRKQVIHCSLNKRNEC